MSNVISSVAITSNGNCDADASTHTTLPSKVLAALDTIVRKGAILEYKLEAKSIAGVSENSYGALLHVTATRTLSNNPAAVRPLCAVVKIAPTNSARRANMLVPEYYEREVFMYQQVLRSYQQLDAERVALSAETRASFDVVPQMLHYSLEPCEEFVIFEDLCQHGYVQNERMKRPTHQLVSSAITALARFHAMSFVLRAKQPQRFDTYIAQLKENLFTEQINPISIEFGRKYLRDTQQLLQSEGTASCLQLIPLLERVHQQFKEICMRCVNGAAIAPYAVICHGDFWNNNILYKHDEQHDDTTAKLIDFQMSRYASPVLDLMHYIFTCTTKTLRDAHFPQLLRLYHETLTAQLALFDLKASVVYPLAVFEQQMQEFGIYGLCIATFAVPFYIAEGKELPDLDEVSEAMQGLCKRTDVAVAEHSTAQDTAAAVAEQSTAQDTTAASAVHSNAQDTAAQKIRDFVDDYNLITPRNFPIFKEHMIGIAIDLVAHKLVSPTLNPHRQM